MSASTTINLLPQEEIGMLLRRLADASADHITLAIPDKSIAGQNVIGLQLLANEAKRLGKTITIVSDSPQTAQLARRVGLSVAGGQDGLPEHGFVSGADVAEIAPVVAASAKPAAEETPKKEQVKAEPRPATAGMAAGWVSKIFGGGRTKWIAAAVVALLVLSMGGVYAYTYYVPRATVTVYAEKESLDRDVNILVDPNATVANVKTLTVPATRLEAKADKSQTFEATGKKDVGAKASGVVTIYNKTDTAKTLNAGTVLGADGMQFLTSKAITIEAATTETGIDPITLKMTTVTTPGSADVSVVAADIGEKYNLDAKTTFVVAKFDTSSFSGRNSKALAGGSKKTVTIVTASDQAKALEQLESALTDESLKTLKSKVPSGRELLEETVKQDVSTKEFSEQVGDQAESFTLTLSVTASGLAVDPADIKSMLSTEMGTKVPDGYKLDAEHSTIENHVMGTEDDGAVRVTSTYKAQVIPEVDVDAMRKAIAGKNPSVVQDYLKSQPNLNGYDITLTPKLPGPFYHLPSIESHIEIQVEVK
jgi:hypothetical protein